MKKSLLFLFIFQFFIIRATDLVCPNPYSASFKKAYVLNPSIPKGVLEAIAFTQTRFKHLTQDQEPSCIGIPQAKTVMGLIEDGKNYFRNNLIKVSQLSGFRVDEINSNPELSILAYAKAFSQLQNQKSIYGTDLASYMPIFIELSELPLEQELQQNFALSSHLYQLYWFLNNKECQLAYNLPAYSLDLASIFGDNYSVLSSSYVTISEKEISGNGNSFKLNNNVTLAAAPDYPPAIWDPTSCNWSSRSGTPISAVTIHFVQGSYAGCISWFKNCSANASAHYVLRSSDGQVTQMVLESNKAWHVGSENPYTVGLEHEGYINNISWFTTAMYNSSGVLTRDICNDNGINKLRTYFGPGCTGTTPQCLQGSCVKVKGHQMYPSQSHTDPGPNWNWERYYKIINNTYSITATYTNYTGVFYDSGGASANYGNDERKFWLFTKPGTTNITLSFTSFNLENNYDYLIIYNGGSVNSPLVGKYTGTVSPGPLVSVNDSVLVEFRSDCATTSAGWAANYTMNGTVTPTPTDNIAPTTVVNPTSAWVTSSFTSSITDTDNLGGSGIEKGYYQVIDFDGTEWRANNTNGFFADNFDAAIHPEWTQAVGTWSIQGNALVQTDEVSGTAGNTNIYASLTQSLSNRYLYHFVTKFEGTGTNRRGGFHFACDNPSQSNRGNSYFVWFRVDQSLVELYKVVANTFTAPVASASLTVAPNTWYDYKTIYDRITGKISVYVNNNPVLTWTDTAPYTNGNSISFRSGNCKMSVDELKVYRSRNATVGVSVGSAPTNDLRYRNPSPAQNAGKIKSICQDFAGNLSAIYYQDIDVDWTPPMSIPFVNDGPASDIATVNTSDSLRANWGASSDTNSAIGMYWYSIGTAPGLTDVKGWTQNFASTSVTAYSLVLSNNTMYYFNVRAENGAGLLSSIISSNGQLVSTTPVSIAESQSLILNAVFPNPFKDELNIQINNQHNGKLTLQLFDAGGKIIVYIESKEEAGTLNKAIKTGHLANGIYILTVDLNGKTQTLKVVKD